MDPSEAPVPGAAAPPFQLPDVDGRPVSLQELHREGPALIVFYRGWW